MTRIVLGNREGSLAILKARSVLERLADEWPDLHLSLRTVPRTAGQESGPLLTSLLREEIAIAVVQLDALPYELPDGVRLAAILRRPEPRSALAAKGRAAFSALPDAANVLAASERDAAFLRATQPQLRLEVDTSAPDVLLKRLAVEVDAVVLPAATLVALDLRSAVNAVLDEAVFTPAPAQSAVGLVVRNEDDLAFETAYSLQHRPSFDRVRAERAFAAALPGRHVGALATVTEDGELTLFGAVAQGATVLQASLTGEAREAEDLGRDLAQDVAEQLAALS
jgi:hydroxymethylbilane synthase